jgi:hypothetical protein
MDEYLAPDAQIFTLGCNATSFPYEYKKNYNLTLPSLSESVSANLPNRQVFGFNSLHFLSFTKASFSNDKLDYNHILLKEQIGSITFDIKKQLKYLKILIPQYALFQTNRI